MFVQDPAYLRRGASHHKRSELSNQAPFFRDSHEDIGRDGVAVFIRPSGESLRARAITRRQFQNWLVHQLQPALTGGPPELLRQADASQIELPYRQTQSKARGGSHAAILQQLGPAAA